MNLIGNIPFITLFLIIFLSWNGKSGISQYYLDFSQGLSWQNIKKVLRAFSIILFGYFWYIGFTPGSIARPYNNGYGDSHGWVYVCILISICIYMISCIRGQAEQGMVTSFKEKTINFVRQLFIVASFMILILSLMVSNFS